MTFMDEIWEDNETVSKNATRQLQLWLGTISHVDSHIAYNTQMALAEMIRSAGWDTEYEDQLGIHLVKVP